jgi:hypothetical protein
MEIVTENFAKGRGASVNNPALLEASIRIQRLMRMFPTPTEEDLPS